MSIGKEKRRMLCKFCQDEGTESYVFEGESRTTLSMCVPFYDKSGKYHYHDTNQITTSYTCSNKHKFTIKKVNGSNCCKAVEEKISVTLDS